jgi:hypothetical protein
MPLVALVEAIAAKQATVLWVQDLHWADPSTLALLRRLPPLVSAPVLIVVNYRPRILPGIGEERIIVDDLTDDQVSTMLLELLDGTLADSLLNVVAAPAGGARRRLRCRVRTRLHPGTAAGCAGWHHPARQGVRHRTSRSRQVAFAYRAMDQRRAIQVLLRP